MMTSAQLLAQRVAAEHLAAASSAANGSIGSAKEHIVRRSAQPENNANKGAQAQESAPAPAQPTTAGAEPAAAPTSAQATAMLAAQSALEASSSPPAQVAETTLGAPDNSAGPAAPSSGAHALAMLAAQSALEDSTASAHVTVKDRKHMLRQPRQSSDYVADHPTSHGKPLTISTKVVSSLSSKNTDCRRYSQNDVNDDDENSVSDISNASRTSRSNSQSMSRTSSLSGNLSGSKRPSADSLSVTGQLQRVLGATSDGSSSSGALGGRRALSRTMSKRSRGSLRSFRSNLGMVGEDSTLMSPNDTLGRTKSNANADWNLASHPTTHHPSNPQLLHPQVGSSAGLHRPPSSTAMGAFAEVRSMLQEHARQESIRSLLGGSLVSGTPTTTASLNSTMPGQEILLQRNKHISSSHRNMSSLGVGGAKSQSSMTNLGNRNMSHAAMSFNNPLTSMASRNSMKGNASGPTSAPKPNNPFLGGGSVSAAANFLNMMGPAPSAATQTSQPTARPLSGSGLSGPSPQMAKMHGLSSATQDFLSLLQQPAGIGSVQTLIQSQKGQDQPPARAQLPTKDKNRSNAAPATPSQPQHIKIPSVVGTCRGSTPRKIDGGIKVKDDGSVVNGQTASEVHKAQTDSKDPFTMSPQELLVATIEARGGDPTIRPVLDVDDMFHTHTDEEIAVYPPTAMLVRNNDLAGLKMAHQSGSKLQTSNKFGESLLHIACRRGYDHIVRYLIEKADVNVWVRDDFGRTPCHDACWTAKPNLELMDLLVTKCPEMLLMSDKRGSTPLDYVRRDNWDIWRKFLEDRWDVVIPRKA